MAQPGRFPSPAYRGRFAPSPTGPLHFGSLIAAVGSYLEARRHDGEWLVRIEDLDGPRCKPAWAGNILRTLEAFGFEWQGKPVYQSQRDALYLNALDSLEKRGMTYVCACSRSELADSSLHGIEGPIYPGTCRNGLPAGRAARAIRLRTESRRIAFTDAIQGEIGHDVAQAISDFVIRRADGPVAYQLAVVVDDAEQGITHVVRGADLLLSTPRQIYLQELLGFGTPRYAHLPIAVNAAGEKLSKQTAALAVDAERAAQWLAAVLRFLGHAPPSNLPSQDLWKWSFEHWNATLVPQLISASGETLLARK